MPNPDTALAVSTQSDSLEVLTDPPHEYQDCVDHTRKARLHKVRPNSQRDMTALYIAEQLDKADSNRPEAIRVAKAEKRALGNEDPEPQHQIDDAPKPLDDIEEDLTTLAGPVLAAHIDSIPLYANQHRCAAVTTAEAKTDSLLGPRDLSDCPVYDPATDDLTCLSTLPANIFAQALINDHKVAAIVDTGARATLLHGQIFDEIPVDNRPLLQPSQVRFISATGTSDFAVRGVARMSVTIAGTTGDVLVTVCDKLHVQCLIGDDFLIRYGVSPCRDDVCVRSRNGSTPYHVLYRIGTGLHVRFVSARHDWHPVLLVPPFHSIELWIPAPKMLKDGEIFFIEPSRAAILRGIIVARKLTAVVRGRLHVQMINTTASTVKIHGHDEIARLMPDFPDACTFDDSLNTPDYGDSLEASAYQDSNADIGVVSTMPLPRSTDHAALCTAIEPLDMSRLFDLLDLTDSVFATGDLHVQFSQFLSDFKLSFALHDDDYGRTTLLQHHIVTDPQAAPVYQRPRPIPLRVRKDVELEVNNMLKAGIIVPSSSEWSSPIVVVKKKDGGIRLCVDYRALNDVTVKDSFPLPRIDDLLHALHGASLYTTMDLQKGFHQIEMAPDSRCKTAFAVPWGLYEYQVMPFGVCNGPSSFQRLVTMALGDLLFTDCLAYIDDILVYARDAQEMLVKLRRVFERLSAAGLKVKPQKCHFGVFKVDFLGHNVSSEGTRPLQSKLTKIMSQARPNNVTELRSFLGLTNYYRDYVRNYSQLASPLYDLLRKAVPWEWRVEHATALCDLQNAFDTATLLGHPTENDVFVLDTDASDTGMGGVLSQIQNGVERVICCGSRVLTPAEKNYDVTRRELLAIVFFCRHFRYFLYGAPFALRTDHAALRWLLSPSTPATGQNARWLSTLADFPMVVFHRGGHLHSNADALSRAPLLFMDGQLTPWPSHTVNTEQDHVMIAVVLARYGTVPPNASLDELLNQSKDSLLTDVIAAVTTKTWPTPALLPLQSAEFRAYHARRNILKIESNNLYLSSFHHGDTPILLLIVPRIARSSVIAECHDATSAAHFAERKTLHSLRQRFWWPQIREDVKLYCRHCPTCQLCTRRAVPAGHAPMATYHAGAPYEVLGLDFMGPISPTARRNRYILTMVDHYTRLTMLVPTRLQTAEATVNALVAQWVVHYGVPRIIHTDRGTNFMSLIMTTLCERLGVRRTRTTPYRPQADGRVERANRTIKECLTRLLHEQPADWDVLLPQVSMAINSTVHDSTGFTPFYLTHGSEMQLPLDLVASLPLPVQRPIPDHVDELLRRFSVAYTLAQATMGRQAVRSKRLYDATARTIFYTVGDKVYVSKRVPAPGDHTKFYAPWTGPCTVLDVISDLNIRIRHDELGWERVVHVDTLCKKPIDLDDTVSSPSATDPSQAATTTEDASTDAAPASSLSADQPTTTTDDTTSQYVPSVTDESDALSLPMRLRRSARLAARPT